MRGLDGHRWRTLCRGHLEGWIQTGRARAPDEHRIRPRRHSRAVVLPASQPGRAGGRGARSMTSNLGRALAGASPKSENWFQALAAGTELPSDAARELDERGFVVLPGPM